MSFEPPARASAYARAHRLPFRFLSDPERRLYGALASRRGRPAEVWSRSTLWAYLVALLHGKLPALPRGDLAQMGGDFVLDPAGTVIFAHRSATPADRPAINTLLEAVVMANTRHLEDR